MKKYIVPIALLTVGVSFVYFRSFSRELRPNQTDFFEEEVAFSVDPMPAHLARPAVQPLAQEYGYGQAPLGKPAFEFGAIKLKAVGFPLNRMKCGGITLVPRPGAAVQVRAQRFVKNYWAAAAKPGKNLSKWTDLDEGGMRVKYDRAGGGQDYYKVFCRLKGSDRTIECQRVLTIQDFKQGHCMWGPGGVDASYSPLNMNVKNK